MSVSVLSRVAVAATAAAVAAMAEGPRDYAGYSFEAFISELGRNYGSEELELRRGVFAENLVKVLEHNARYAAGAERWWMEMNSFADWTADEFQGMLGQKGAGPAPGALSSLRPRSKEELPASVDWREKGVVTPVKNQGNCGSCWAFASTETVESAYAVASGQLLELAPQAYVSCMKNPNGCGGTGGCQGAIAELAFNYTVDNGLPLSTDYAYTASDSACKQFTPAVKVSGYVRLPANDADALATALATVGPVAVSVAATQFYLYGGGVFEGCCGWMGGDINHDVQAVGYSADYWLIRNSWGESWGEAGYIRLSRSKDAVLATDHFPKDGFSCTPYPSTIQVGGECGVLSDSSYPTGARAATGGETLAV